MRKAEKIYTYAVLAEGMVLFIFSVLTILWMWQLETEHKAAIIRRMTLSTLVITCVLIPAETVFMDLRYKKRGTGREGAFRSRISQTVLPRMQTVFAVLWFIHFVSVELIAYRYNWRYGSDIYMYYARPGSRIILMSLAAAWLPLYLYNKHSGKARTAGHDS